MNNEQPVFSVKIREFDHGIILDLTGELSKLAETTMLNIIKWDQMQQVKKNVVFNFCDLKYVNSAGISIVIRVIKAANKSSCNLFAFGLSTLQQKLFRAVGITEHIIVYPDEYSVLQRIENII